METKEASASSAPAKGETVIVGVSSCPTGIAHTFMAAEALEQAGKDRGITVAIEGQGSGKIDALDPELIKRASAVIFAHDLPVKGRERFAGKPVIDVGVKAPSTTPAPWWTRLWPRSTTRAPPACRPAASPPRRARRALSTGPGASSARS